MSGYRACVGYGKLNRTDKIGPAEMPGGMTVYNPNDTTTSCVHQLKHRFGAGIDISINRNRNNNYKQDIGLREFTVATSGMLDIDFTINGAFAPSCCDWIQYGIMSELVDIDKDSTFVDSTGTATTDDVGYVKTGGVVGTTPIEKVDFDKYLSQIKENGIGHIKVFSYVNLDGPMYFDIAYEQINKNTTFGAQNEIGLLMGCVIDNFSISYESGSDATVQFSISGIALSNYFRLTDDAFDMNSILDEIPATVMVAGCVSADKNNSGTYETIAQTDSASISVSNNTTKLGNCLKLYYSAVALGAQTIEMSTSTYSNDPNKYMSYMYGYTQFKEVDGDNKPIDYTIAKRPLPIPKMLIRTDNSSSELSTEKATEFLNIQLTDVFVGSANRSYSVDNAIMDEPDLRPRKVKFVVGYTDTSGVKV